MTHHRRLQPQQNTTQNITTRNGVDGATTTTSGLVAQFAQPDSTQFDTSIDASAVTDISSRSLPMVPSASPYLSLSPSGECLTSLDRYNLAENHRLLLALAYVNPMELVQHLRYQDWHQDLFVYPCWHGFRCRSTGQIPCLEAFRRKETMLSHFNKRHARWSDHHSSAQQARQTIHGVAIDVRCN